MNVGVTQNENAQPIFVAVNEDGTQCNNVANRKCFITFCSTTEL